jgi:hypothetical protein
MENWWQKHQIKIIFNPITVINPNNLNLKAHSKKRRALF